MSIRVFLIAILAIAGHRVSAQLCVNPSQTPSTALLVCGTASFTQTTVQFCGQTPVPVPCPAGYTYINANPNYFRMACYAAGTLGFTIVPDDPMANFDWQLFDITNTNPEDIFTNPGLFEACNWSSEVGETGASVDGTDLVVCGGSGQPLFSKMPNIQVGRTYMLMVINQSNSAAPYHLTFQGGTASITDAVEPHLRSARLNCEGTQVIIRLNKDMKCTSLSMDGSDFTLTGGASFIAADPGDCNAFSGSDSIILTLDRPLLNGNYTLTIGNGSDGNTLVDNCNRTIPVGESIPLIAAPPLPTPLDSVKPVDCKPGFIELVFNKPMRCNTIASDGSDFIVTGPAPVSITGVSLTCGARNTTPVIRINFASPVLTAGTYQVELTTGTDGNTLADECGMVTAAGASVNFQVLEGVSARFTYTIQPSCKDNIVAYLHSGGSGISSWNWNLGAPVANIPNPVINYPDAFQQTVSLTVTNGICTDTHSELISVDNKLNASFEVPTLLCPGEPLKILNTSKGNIDHWEWDFGNGNTAISSTPPDQVFVSSATDQQYVIRLIAGNTNLNCFDTVSHIVKVPVNCRIAVPGAFTPNNDGRNDFFYPINGHIAKEFDFQVYNRNGELVFATKDWSRKWDGKRNGIPQTPGVYVWMLSYIEEGSNRRTFLKGTVMLIR